MKNNSWCLETYKLSELHFFATSHHPGLIPEGVCVGGGGGVWKLFGVLKYNV